MGLVRTVSPAAQPLELAELAAYLKIPEEQLGTASVQAYLTGLLNGAVECCERVARRALITQTWQLTLDGFCDERNFAVYDCRRGWLIEAPRPPLIAVTSIQYVDNDGATQTLAASEYQVDAKEEPGRILQAYGRTWPSTRDQANAVTVTYTAGYGASGTSVPDEIKARLKAHCAYCHENRGDKGMGSKDAVDTAFLDNLFEVFWHGGH